MTGYEICLPNQIGGADWHIPETEMGNRKPAGFFGVVIEVSLHVFVRMVAYNFYGIFIGADSAVSSQPPEFAAYGGGRGSMDGIRNRQ